MPRDAPHAYLWASDLAQPGPLAVPRTVSPVLTRRLMWSIGGSAAWGTGLRCCWCPASRLVYLAVLRWCRFLAARAHPIIAADFLHVDTVVVGHRRSR
jgi:hypothetical protein